MDSLNQIVAENIQYYRNRMKWTQAELAERIHYSDKSVSKWERGEGMPDLAVCTLLADLFGVTVDDLIRRHEVMPQPKQTRMSFNHRIITALSLVGVLAIALILYIVLEDWEERYRVFIYALPVMSLVVLVLNSIWGKRMANLYIISLLVWTVLWSLVLLLHTPSIFYIGILAQAAVLLAFCFHKKGRDK